MKRPDAGMPGRMAHVETPMNRSYLFADVTVAIAAENATVDIDRSRDRDVDCETVQYDDWYDEKHRYQARDNAFHCHGDSLGTEEDDMTIASLRSKPSGRATP
jgi:hypothetical protein